MFRNAALVYLHVSSLSGIADTVSVAAYIPPVSADHPSKISFSLLGGSQKTQRSTRGCSSHINYSNTIMQSSLLIRSTQSDEGDGIRGYAGSHVNPRLQQGKVISDADILEVSMAVVRRGIDGGRY